MNVAGVIGPSLGGVGGKIGVIAAPCFLRSWMSARQIRGAVAWETSACAPERAGPLRAWPVIAGRKQVPVGVHRDHGAYSGLPLARFLFGDRIDVV